MFNRLSSSTAAITVKVGSIIRIVLGERAGVSGEQSQTVFSWACDGFAKLLSALQDPGNALLRHFPETEWRAHSQLNTEASEPGRITRDRGLLEGCLSLIIGYLG